MAAMLLESGNAAVVVPPTIQAGSPPGSISSSRPSGLFSNGPPSKGRSSTAAPSKRLHRTSRG